MYEIDVAIIGAGVVGLAIGKAIAKKYNNVVILEQHDSFGQETSSRNSEVIHAGIYYPKDTLKAKLCVQGNRMLYEICKTHGIRYNQLGKFIVAVNDAETLKLEALEKRGTENGVPGLAFYDLSDVKRLEPSISVTAALFSPTTGIIDVHGLMKHYAQAAESNGAMIVYHSKVIEINPEKSGLTFTVQNADKGLDRFQTKILINAAGLHCDTIAQLAGIDIDQAGYRLHYCKGDYMAWSKKILNHLIYPLPDQFSIGIHACLDLNLDVKFGPNVYFVDSLNYDVASTRESFYQAIQKYLPEIALEDLRPAMSGIRPKIQSPKDAFKDFVICHESSRGLTGLINLIGIESPGLTASPAIAEYALEMVDSIMEGF